MKDRKVLLYLGIGIASFALMTVAVFFGVGYLAGETDFLDFLAQEPLSEEVAEVLPLEETPSLPLATETPALATAPASETEAPATPAPSTAPLPETEAPITTLPAETALEALSSPSLAEESASTEEPAPLEEPTPTEQPTPTPEPVEDDFSGVTVTTGTPTREGLAGSVPLVEGMLNASLQASINRSIEEALARKMDERIPELTPTPAPPLDEEEEASEEAEPEEEPAPLGDARLELREAWVTWKVLGLRVKWQRAGGAGTLTLYYDLRNGEEYDPVALFGSQVAKYEVIERSVEPRIRDNPEKYNVAEVLERLYYSIPEVWLTQSAVYFCYDRDTLDGAMHRIPVSIATIPGFLAESDFANALGKFDGKTLGRYRSLFLAGETEEAPAVSPEP